MLIDVCYEVTDSIHVCAYTIQLLRQLLISRLMKYDLNPSVQADLPIPDSDSWSPIKQCTDVKVISYLTSHVVRI